MIYIFDKDFMKKITAFLLSAAFNGIAFGQSDSFHEDSRNFDIKLDFAAYNGTVTHNVSGALPSNAAAACVILTPQMEWAVSSKVSLGGSFAYSHYLDSARSASSSPQLNGIDGNFIFNLHFLRTPKTDMMIGFKLGIAGVRYSPNDGSGNIYGSLGGAADVHLTGRFYVSNHLAIIGNISFPSYIFNKFGKNLTDTYTIRFHGVCIGTGIAIKLSNQGTAGTQRNK
jgi:hypothetical protein